MAFCLTSSVHRHLLVVMPTLRPGDERASYVSKNSILLEHHPSNGGERATWSGRFETQISFLTAAPFPHFCLQFRTVCWSRRPNYDNAITRRNPDERWSKGESNADLDRNRHIMQAIWCRLVYWNRPQAHQTGQQRRGFRQVAGGSSWGGISLCGIVW